VVRRGAWRFAQHTFQHSASPLGRLLLPWRDEILATAKACDQASDVHAQAPINFMHLELMRIIGIGMFGQVRTRGVRDAMYH
jgi:hypothetical protein